MSPLVGHLTPLRTGNDSNTSFVGSDVGMRCRYECDVWYVLTVHCRHTIATCLIPREACLFIGGTESTCSKCVSGDNGLWIWLFTARGPNPSFSILSLDKRWRLVFNFIFVDTDTNIFCVTPMLGSLRKPVQLIPLMVLTACLIVRWGCPVFLWQSSTVGLEAYELCDVGQFIFLSVDPLCVCVLPALKNEYSMHGGVAKASET